jgi:hypothetical protein
MPSRQALVDLQDVQTRSPGHELVNSELHIRQFRRFFSYARSDLGLEFFVESLMAAVIPGPACECNKNVAVQCRI